MNLSADFFKNYFDKHQEALLQDFYTLLRFKSISSEPEYQEEMSACVNWLADYAEKLGFTTKIQTTAGHPYLAAEWLGAGEEKPTVLIYAHYDVQPVDPLELWHSPPFEPTLRDGEIYARGAVDNKGQCFYVLAALQALREEVGEFPLNIKLCIEGEEEVGSAGLTSALALRAEEFQADYILIVDLGINSLHSPAVTLGCRGIATMSVELQGSNSDLHSGEHGGLAQNPLHALVSMLSKLRDGTGRVLVPGFYDKVSKLSQLERESMDFSFDEQEYAELFGGPPTGGETEFSALESCWIRPTVELNGVWGGYNGEGFKTVIPAKAYAKISCRLVPDQVPEEVLAGVKTYLESLTPSGMKLSIRLGSGAAGIRGRSDSKATAATRAAYSEVLELPCSNILCGGTIPIASSFALNTKADLVMLGYGLPGDNMHAPNEHFGLDRLKLGMATIGVLLQKLGVA
jgi:acetylornithine deacetylase/succinyl-diaminopimelate desuccinylase-like protein